MIFSAQGLVTVETSAGTYDLVVGEMVLINNSGGFTVANLPATGEHGDRLGIQVVSPAGAGGAAVVLGPKYIAYDTQPNLGDSDLRGMVWIWSDAVASWVIESTIVYPAGA